MIRYAWLDIRAREFISTIFIVLLFIPAIGSAGLTEITISDMKRDILCLDMEGCPAGAIGSSHPCFHTINIIEVQLLGDWYDDGDIMNSGPDGHALCCYDDVLTIVEPDGFLYDPTGAEAGFRFEVAPGGAASQFGFRIVDQIGWTVDISVYDKGMLLSNITRSITAYTSIYYQSSEPFDAFEIKTTSSTGGWCIDDVCLADFPGPPPTFTSTYSPTHSPTMTPTPAISKTPPDIHDTTPSTRRILIMLFGLIIFLLHPVCKLITD